MSSHARLVAFGARQLDLSRPHVMGILNITPDSFSDGGELLVAGKPRLDAILRRAESMVLAGATFLDIGGESTRPGAALVSPQEELDRVLPVLEALRGLDAVLSLDTSNAELVREGARAGAGLINDVRALQRPGALEAAVHAGIPVCLMHMQGQPATMQEAPHYADVVAEVSAFLRERMSACMQAGLASEQLLVDPGFGFGKTLQHNLQLLHGLEAFVPLAPVLVGVSRKRMLGAITGKPEKERVVAGAAAAVIAVMKGACIIRTHDVDATVDAVKVCRAVQDISDN